MWCWRMWRWLQPGNYLRAEPEESRLAVDEESEGESILIRPRPERARPPRI